MRYWCAASAVFVLIFSSKYLQNITRINAHLGVFLVRCKTRMGVLFLALPLLTT